MADYYGTIRTNYFSVTNEAKFREIIASCYAYDEIHILESIQEDGSKKFGFGCYEAISGIPSDDGDGDGDDKDMDALYDALQKVLPKGDAIMITEVGSKELHYLVGNCVVITPDDIQYVDVWGEALKLARRMLGNEKFETKCDIDRHLPAISSGGVKMQVCERCGQSSPSSRMSFFNTQMICPACQKTEKAHPDYQVAHDTETEAVRQGDYNFPGVGLPDDLARRCPHAPLKKHEENGENE